MVKRHHITTIAMVIACLSAHEMELREQQYVRRPLNEQDKVAAVQEQERNYVEIHEK